MAEAFPENHGERYVSVRAVAETDRLSLAKLIAACEERRLAAREFGGEWYVSESAIPDCRTLGEVATMFDWRQPLLRPLAVLFLLISIVAVTESLWQARTWQDLAAGANLTVSAIRQSLAAVARISPDQPAAVFAEVQGNLTRLWFAVFDFWQTLAANLDYGWQKVVAGWSGFLGRSPPPLSAGEPPVIDPALIARLKAEIKEELTRELELPRAGAIPSQNQKSPGTGLVVLPSSGNLAVDRAMAQELEQTFSDQVEVRFEASGQTGLITPIFRGGRGGDYLFVITPIKEKTLPP